MISVSDQILEVLKVKFLPQDSCHSFDLLWKSSVSPREDILSASVRRGSTWFDLSSGNCCSVYFCSLLNSEILNHIHLLFTFKGNGYT